MSLDYSIASIMSRLVEWGALPKYQLERRVDIFLTPFLERFIGRRLNGRATLVAPEFPLPRSLKDAIRTDAVVASDSRTINVDYLFSLQRPDPHLSAWVLLELKTDPGSSKDEQDVAYRTARSIGMHKLRGFLDQVRKDSKKHRAKYDRLLSRIYRRGFACDRIELAYLTPHNLAADLADPADNPTHSFSLRELAEQPRSWVAPEHRELWPHVRDLLLAVDAAHGVRSARKVAP